MTRKGPRSIRSTLLLSHVAAALFSMLTVTVLVYAAVGYTFDGYVRDRQKSEAEAVVQELADSYSVQNGWSPSAFMSVTHRAMQKSFAVQITDANGKTLWNSAVMTPMGGHSAGPDTGIERSADDDTYRLPIVKDGSIIGELRLAGTGGLYREQEKSFWSRLNVWIWAACGMVLLGTFVFSRWLSGRMSEPLKRMEETARRMKDGDLEARAPMQDGHREIASLQTVLNHLADKLQRQELLRKTMTADIAHELRTPITTVQGYIEAFQDGIWEPTQEKLQACHRQITQLSHIIRDLEKLAEAENPMLTLQPEPVDLIAILEESRKAASEPFSGMGIRYHPPEQSKLMIPGDPRRLIQIFTNLFTNAYKYNREQGSIRVRIADCPEDVTITVSDTGIGIREEELPYVFERFYRGEKSRNRKLGGAGIGLAVVKALVEAHGGWIYAESAEQEGTSFILRLPKIT